MKNILWILLFLPILLNGCKHSTVSSKDKPDQAAIHYIQCIADEKFDECINGMASCDSASDSYKAKMKILYKQFIRHKKKESGFLKKVECIHTDFAQNGNYADTYIRLTYKNDSVETIILPLIWKNKRWRMR